MNRLPLRLALAAMLLLPLSGQTCNTCPDTPNPCTQAVSQTVGELQQCIETPVADYKICDIPGPDLGWCIDGQCVTNSCDGVVCPDTPCEDHYCNPQTGACVAVPKPGAFPACQTPTGGPGACFGTTCVPGGSVDECVKGGYGRLNCCNICDLGNVDCFQPSADGTPCDPTGEEPINGSNQVGECQGGECVYTFGPCEPGNLPNGTCRESPDNQCTMDLCLISQGGQAECANVVVEGYPGCGGGVCVEGECQISDGCVNLGTGREPCCAFGGLVPAGNRCDPNGVLAAEPDTDPALLGGICIESGTQIPDCIWEACDGVDCDDNNECTVDECLESGQCSNVVLTGFPACDNGAGVCADGFCRVLPCTQQSCDDGKNCTADSCDALGGCVNSPLPAGTSCVAVECFSGMCDGNETCIVEPEPNGTPCSIGVCVNGICTDLPWP